MVQLTSADAGGTDRGAVPAAGALQLTKIVATTDQPRERQRLPRREGQLRPAGFRACSEEDFGVYENGKLVTTMKSEARVASRPKLFDAHLSSCCWSTWADQMVDLGGHANIDHLTEWVEVHMDDRRRGNGADTVLGTFDGNNEVVPFLGYGKAEPRSGGPCGSSARAAGARSERRMYQGLHSLRDRLKDRPPRRSRAILRGVHQSRRAGAQREPGDAEAGLKETPARDLRHRRREKIHRGADRAGTPRHVPVQQPAERSEKGFDEIGGEADRDHRRAATCFRMHAQAEGQPQGRGRGGGVRRIAVASMFKFNADGFTAGCTPTKKPDPHSPHTEKDKEEAEEES